MTQTALLTQTDGSHTPTSHSNSALIPLLLLLLQAVHPAQAALEGSLGTANCDAVKGWAWNNANPATRVQVDVFEVTPTARTLLTTLTAQPFKQDVLDAGKGDCKYGFAFVLPTTIRNTATHKLSVRFKGTTTELTGSPKTTSACYGKLNDTGWQKCSTSTGNGLTCPLTDYPRQDGDYGRDAKARKGQLVKVGKGSAGFDYSKIANDGSVLPETAKLGKNAKDWACTRDNLSGLLWEVKTTDGGLRDVYNTYSWYSPDSATNAGYVGYQDNGNCTGGIACDTYSYAQAVKATKLCGKIDWRLPSVDELFSLVDYSRSVAINPIYFPNTKAYWYGTATVGPFDYNNTKKGVWGVYATDGYVDDDMASPYGVRVRLVSGNEVLVKHQIGNVAGHECLATALETSPTSRFVLNNDGTALDKQTGLIWKRCLEGYTWNGSSCQGTASLAAWQDALKKAAASSFLGKTGWRLPNVKELAGIAERACINPQVNLAVFPNMPTLFIWSSTPSAHDAAYAWTGGSGYQNHWDYYAKSSANGVLFVRDAP